MSGRIRRSLFSVAFFLRKAYRRIATAKPSMLMVTAILVAFSIFLFGGGLYDLLGEAVPYIVVARRIFVFYPLIHEQSILESVFATISYIIGVTGFLLAYQSTKYTYKPRQAFILLLMGCLFIGMAYIYLEYAVYTKMTGFQ